MEQKNSSLSFSLDHNHHQKQSIKYQSSSSSSSSINSFESNYSLSSSQNSVSENFVRHKSNNLSISGELTVPQVQTHTAKNEKDAIVSSLNEKINEIVNLKMTLSKQLDEIIKQVF